MKPISTPSQTKALLAKYDLYAKKNYGQNFIIDPSVVEKIARNAIISDNTVAFEIGPGIGALTQYLCEYAKHVVCFEIDERLPEVLKNDSLKDYDNYEIILQDFLEIDLNAWVEKYTSQGYDVVIAANLPYYITTPIIFKVFDSHVDIKAMTVMMQKEVGDRFYAKVNTKEYNALSIIAQYLCNIKKVMNVAKNVFMPKPNVDSCVLQFTLKNRDESFEEKAYFELVKACFKQRRKTIYNNLSEYVKDKAKAKQYLVKAQIVENARAESLEQESFLRLFEVINNDQESTCEN